MRPLTQKQWVVRFGYSALAFLFLVLVYRCERAVTAVIGTQSLQAMPAETPTGRMAFTTLAARDSLIATAFAPGRDPFRAYRPPAAAAQPAAQANRPPALPVAPRLQAVLFDQANPLVKLVVGEKVSDWLHIGLVFQGWTIVDISETTVEVHDTHRTMILRAR